MARRGRGTEASFWSYFEISRPRIVMTRGAVWEDLEETPNRAAGKIMGVLIYLFFYFRKVLGLLRNQVISMSL
jgi:hypothetical protein